MHAILYYDLQATLWIELLKTFDSHAAFLIVFLAVVKLVFT